ncbi:MULTISPECIES: Gfo/Idh/MocA family protein [unclassified Amycolatopsis]|uniref:Gfo/Idh/MocA family protein n=1 Tax=unclassified Amycolatopsis TaxID=2618356 RepID=UPI001C6982D8|nr:Gfo/Idh/MocA family oxidoreductase [Amycolatopsis sp. DSM 110486]QYN17791.1 Gfo/Idh/MocA family oxidoreductase [Amycolatopsis sp. DSM 110486]
MANPGGGRLRLGVLGCSGIAWRRTLPAVAEEPRLALVAVASRDAARAAEFAARFGGEPVQGYQRLLDRSDVDAVYVPLPAALHAHWVLRALDAGKHVLVEKPFATSRAEVAAILDLASARGLRVMENFMFLYHGQHESVRRLVADGEIGELHTFSSAFGIPSLPDSDVRYRKDLGGGALLDVGVYPLRAAQLFLGPELVPVASILHVDPVREIDVRGHVLLRSPSGRSAELTFGFGLSYRCTYSLWGSAGRIVVDRAYTPPATWQPVHRIERQDEVRELTRPAEDHFAAALRAFAAVVLDGVAPPFGPEDLLRQAALVDRVRAVATEVPG